MSFLDGDGRRKISPAHAPEGTKPKSIRRGTARLLVEMFEERGCSYHSEAGSTVWVLVAYCAEKGIPYRVGQFEHGLWVVAKEKQ